MRLLHLLAHALASLLCSLGGFDTARRVLPRVCCGNHVPQRAPRAQRLQGRRRSRVRSQPQLTQRVETRSAARARTSSVVAAALTSARAPPASRAVTSAVARQRAANANEKSRVRAAWRRNCAMLALLPQHSRPCQPANARCRQGAEQKRSAHPAAPQATASLAGGVYPLSAGSARGPRSPAGAGASAAASAARRRLPLAAASSCAAAAKAAPASSPSGRMQCAHAGASRRLAADCTAA